MLNLDKVWIHLPERLQEMRRGTITWSIKAFSAIILIIMAYKIEGINNT